MASVEHNNIPDSIVEQMRARGLLSDGDRQRERTSATAQSVGDRGRMIDMLVAELSKRPEVQEQFPNIEALRTHVEQVMSMSNAHERFEELANKKEGKSIWTRLWENKWTILTLALLGVAGYYGYQYWNWNKIVSGAYKNAALAVGQGKEMLLGSPSVLAPGITKDAITVAQSGGLGVSSADTIISPYIE